MPPVSLRIHYPRIPDESTFMFSENLTNSKSHGQPIPLLRYVIFFSDFSRPLSGLLAQNMLAASKRFLCGALRMALFLRSIYAESVLRRRPFSLPCWDFFFSRMIDHDFPMHRTRLSGIFIHPLVPLYSQIPALILLQRPSLSSNHSSPPHPLRSYPH